MLLFVNIRFCLVLVAMNFLTSQGQINQIPMQEKHVRMLLMHLLVFVLCSFFQPYLIFGNVVWFKIYPSTIINLNCFQNTLQDWKQSSSAEISL